MSALILALSAVKTFPQLCATVPHNSSLRTSMIATQRKSRIKPNSTNVPGHPGTMSGFERESLAAEAKLKAERNKKKAAKALQRVVGQF